MAMTAAIAKQRGYFAFPVLRTPGTRNQETPQRALIAPGRAIRIYPFQRVSVYAETRIMDARKERGRELAQHGRIVTLTQGWRVPSQSGSGSYFVRLTKTPSCTCPDFEYWHLPCKHIYAVEYLIAHALREQQQRFLAGGLDGGLLKPISFRAVQELPLAQTPCP